MTTKDPQRETGRIEEIRLPFLELARSRAKAQNALFGDDAKVYAGRYELRDRIGSGGMGLVYRAFDPQLERTVALKVLRSSGVESRDVSRLASEATTQASLDDPDVVQVYDVRLRGDVQFLAMELAEGSTLTEWLGREARPASEVVGVFLSAARVLARVHAAGIVHRDFKPDNVVVGCTGHEVRARLLDFGLACPPGETPRAVAGTPGFMAPEVLAGAAPSPRGDQFAFCVSMNEAVRALPISRRLRRVLARGMSERASARWPSMERLIAELENEASRHRRWKITAVAGAATLTLVGLLVWPEPSRDDCGVSATHSRLNDRLTRRVAHEPSMHALLEGKVAEWVETSEAACARSASRALECLQGQAVELESLFEPGENGPSERMLAVTELESSRRCLRPQRGPTPTALARAEAAIALGNRDEARALIADVRGSAGGDAWILANAAWQLGTLEHEENNHAAAQRAYEDAVFLALRAGDDRLVVLASCALVELQLVLGTGPTHREAWIRQARAAASRRGTPALEARVAIASGWQALGLGQRDRAHQEFERGLAAAHEASEEDPTLLLSLHYDLGCALVARREFEAAASHFRSAQQGWSELFGDGAPILALAWRGLGDVARERGRHAEAVDAYERGHALLRTNGEADTLQAAVMDVSLADALYRLGRNDEARDAYLRARTALRGINRSHRFLAAIEIGLGNLARDEHDWETSLESFRRARDLAIEVDGPSSLVVAIASSSAAEAAMNLERYEEAKGLLRASIETRVALEGNDAVSLAFPLTTQGELRRRDGDLDGSLASLERALELRHAAVDLDSRLIAETQFALSKLRRDRGELDLAVATAKDARENFDGPWAHAAQDVAMVDRWLAQAVAGR